MRQINTQIAPLFGLMLMATFAADAFAQFVPIERKYNQDVKYYNAHMAVILETSIYDMHDHADLDDYHAYRMEEATKEPIAEIISGFGHLKASTLPQNSAMATKWGMKDTTSASWLEWFGARVKLITAADETKESFWSDRFEIDKRYPLDAESLRVRKSANQDAMGDEGPIASNILGKLLLRMLQAGFALRYKGPNYPNLVSGANFGIVKLTPSYFADTSFKVPAESSSKKGQASYVAKVYRNAILMHEARHSDGSGAYATFPHVRCPTGHPEANDDPTDFRCDGSQNGANSVAADFIQLYLDGCANGGFNMVCSHDEVAALQGIKLKFESYVIDPAIYPVDGEGNKVVKAYDPAAIFIKGVPTVHMSRE